jgi:hypothetical protein
MGYIASDSESERFPKIMRDYCSDGRVLFDDFGIQTENVIKAIRTAIEQIKNVSPVPDQGAKGPPSKG